jgi:DUF1365 family protein
VTRPARIYFSRVMHQRFEPVQYRFHYRVFSLLLDLDRLDEVSCRLFSVNRFNFVSFRERDHGPRDGTPLKPWIEGLLGEEGIDIAGGRVLLLCFPRVLGYGFNPLSVWYCFHADGSLRAVLAEVNNTFGEHHFYLLSGGGSPVAWPVNYSVEKVFHVSPLMGMDARYSFRIGRPAERVSVLIRQYRSERLALVASQQGRGHDLNDKRLLLALVTIPFMTLKVMAAIHWQALKIWLKGAPFFPKPQPPLDKVTH